MEMGSWFPAVVFMAVSKPLDQVFCKDLIAPFGLALNTTLCTLTHVQDSLNFMFKATIIHKGGWGWS